MCQGSVNAIRKKLLRLNVPFDPEPWKHVRSEEEVDLFSYFVPPLHLDSTTQEHRGSTVHIMHSGGGKTALCQWLIYRALWQPTLTTVTVPIRLSEIANSKSFDSLLFNLQVSMVLFAAHYFPLSANNSPPHSLINLFSSIGSVSRLLALFSSCRNSRKAEKYLISVFGASVVRYVQTERVNRMVDSLSRLSCVSHPISFGDAAKNVMDILGCNLVIVLDDDINCYSSKVAQRLAEEQDNFARNRIPTVSFWSPNFYESWKFVTRSAGAYREKEGISIVWSKELLRSVINERLSVATHGYCPSLLALFPSRMLENVENEIIRRCNTPRECIWATIKAMEML